MKTNDNDDDPDIFLGISQLVTDHIRLFNHTVDLALREVKLADDQLIYSMFVGHDGFHPWMTNREIKEKVEGYRQSIENSVERYRHRMQLKGMDSIDKLRSIPLADLIGVPPSSEVLDQAQNILNDNDQFEDAVERHFQKRMARSEVVSWGREYLASGKETIYEHHTLSKKGMMEIYEQMDLDTEQIKAAVSHREMMKLLIREPLRKVRRTINDYFSDDLAHLAKSHQGFRHILDGGKTVDPRFPTISVVHNPLQIPNIQYSNEVQRNMEAVLQELPEASLEYFKAEVQRILLP